MWYAFTMDYGVAKAHTKRALLNEIQPGMPIKVKRMCAGAYSVSVKGDDGYWYDERFYLFSSKQVAIFYGFSDQLKEFENSES